MQIRETEIKREWLIELLVFIISIVFIAFILALDIKWTLPTVNIELVNFPLNLFYSFIMFTVFVGTQKLVAYARDCRHTLTFLGFRRYWFRPLTEHGTAELPFNFPLWFVLPALLVLVNIKWLAILNFDLEPKPNHVRHRWSNITEEDVGRIAISGPLALMALGILMRIFGAADFAFLCFLFAFLVMIPIGIGFKIVMSSRILWFFSLVFSLVMLLLINLQTTFAIIMTAVIFAALATLAYYVLYEK